MKTAIELNDSTVHNFNALNYVGADSLPRDREQSHRLHEPEQQLTDIDPMTGHDIEDLYGKPYIVDGNVVMYFESEATRQEFRDMPINHPFPLIDNPHEDGDGGG